jgi:pimeloyl-ACP methyl ester carboxylesterase
VDHKTLELRDGRTLSYGELGSGARVIVYCHGFPTNRLELSLFEDAVPDGVRMVAFDRPGYGASTFMQHRQIVDWPEDVVDACDQLGIDRFVVLAVSGGSPYGLALANRLPKRVHGVGVAVGLGPPSAPGMAAAEALKGPSRFGIGRRAQFALMAMAFQKGHEERLVDTSVAGMGEIDQVVLTDPEMRAWFTDTLRESFAQGGRGAAHESGLYRRSWGFDIRGIAQPVRLWAGRQDETVPLAVAEWLTSTIPGSTLQVWPDHGHLSWMTADAKQSVINDLTALLA